MAPKSHSFDLDSEEIVEYIEATADHIAAAVRERNGRAAPWSAPGLTKAQTLDYYRDQLATPEGVQRVLQRVGPQGLRGVYEAVAKDDARRAAEAAPAPADEGGY